MRLAALQSILNTDPAGSSGCPRPRRRRGFPRNPVAPPSVPSPASLRRWVHPLLSLASSSEYVPSRTCPSHGCEERLPWGSTPNRDINTRDPLANGVPPPPYGPPSAFRTPSTVFALCCLVGLFHPTTTSGIRLSGVCSRRQAGPPRRWVVPSCRCPPVPVAGCPSTSVPTTPPSGR